MPYSRKYNTWATGNYFSFQKNSFSEPIIQFLCSPVNFAIVDIFSFKNNRFNYSEELCRRKVVPLHPTPFDSKASNWGDNFGNHFVGRKLSLKSTNEFYEKKIGP